MLSKFLNVIQPKNLKKAVQTLVLHGFFSENTEGVLKCKT